MTRTASVIRPAPGHTILIRVFKRPIHPGWIAYAYAAGVDAVGYYGISRGWSKESASRRMQSIVERDLAANGRHLERMQRDW